MHVSSFTEICLLYVIHYMLRGNNVPFLPSFSHDIRLHRCKPIHVLVSQICLSIVYGTIIFCLLRYNNRRSSLGVHDFMLPHTLKNFTAKVWEARCGHVAKIITMQRNFIVTLSTCYCCYWWILQGKLEFTIVYL